MLEALKGASATPSWGDEEFTSHTQEADVTQGMCTCGGLGGVGACAYPPHSSLGAWDFLGSSRMCVHRVRPGGGNGSRYQSDKGFGGSSSRRHPPPICVYMAGWRVSVFAVLLRVGGWGLDLGVPWVPGSGSQDTCELSPACVSVWLRMGLGVCTARVAAPQPLTARTKASTDRWVAKQTDLPQESSKDL